MFIRPKFDMGENSRGNITMSIQASAFHYCRPRVNGLSLDEYDAVEIGLFLNDEWVIPSEIGVEGFDHLWEYSQYDGRSTVAAAVSQEDLSNLKTAIYATLDPS
jgi:hypothetical protein